MANACGITVDNAQVVESTLDVSLKYKQLMKDTLGAGSLYSRAKTTLRVMFKDLQLDEMEKAKLSVD